ncbi:MAG: sigma-70 family RNA polymerase sigma factor [Thermoguttaceae bacterium]|nr:sigma-70 family RNA polymerase sigma factor [Thermoguttaceae bacterium]
MSSNNENTIRDRAVRIFLQNYGHVRSIAFIASPQRTLVDDIVNDTFVRFVERAEQWDYSGNIPALLSGIVKNVAKEHWRRYVQTLPESVRQVYEWIRNNLARNEDENSDKEDERMRLRNCIEKLSPEHRDIVRRHYYEGMPLSELALENGRNIKTVQKTASRIRIMLYKCMTANEVFGTDGRDRHE